LALVAGLEMIMDVPVHTYPIVAVEETFFGYQNSVVTGEKMPVSFL
jgi:hypothetical protein